MKEVTKDTTRFFPNGSRVPLNALDYFPHEQIRPSQQEAIQRIEKAFQDGVQTVVLEAPVGSGKSAIAISLALLYGSSHILTPRKSLQDQYYEDFHEHLVLMKGRKAYPCYPNPDTQNYKLNAASGKAPEDLSYTDACKAIKTGRTPKFDGLSCSDGPCTKDKAKEGIYKLCTEEGDRPCPYRLAIEHANENSHIVHNLHSFIFQTSFAGWFEGRELLVVDECHDMEGIVRDLLIKKLQIPHVLSEEQIELPEPGSSIQDWVDFFRKPEISPKEGVTGYEEYQETLAGMLEYELKNFTVDVDEDPGFSRTKFAFIPKNIGNAAEAFILTYGKRRLLMSGTIYDKNDFCRRNGIKAEDTCFIRLASTFPEKSRPIHMKERLMVDTSHKCYKENFPQLIENIKQVMGTFADVRGLIHTSSYSMSKQIEEALGSERVISHEASNFMSRLEYFISQSEPNAVFISPTCQQGVDLKDDRCRFQMIVRVPYLNAGDTFIQEMMKEDFAWYNLKALIAFGQMLGRPVRSDTDWGHTILLDSRFKRFIHGNRAYLPKDVVRCLQTK